VAVALAAGAAPLLLSAPAQAASAPAEVTVVHGIPNTPVDVYVDGKLTLPDFTFGKVGGPLALPAGTYAIAVRPYKASPMSAPILSKSVAVTAGEDASIVANLTTSGSPTLSVFANPTTAVPVGDAQVIVRHVAEAPGVDVYAGTSKVITDLTNPNQAALVIPAGKLSVSVDVTGTTTTVIGPATFHFLAGRTTVIYAIGSAAGKTLTIAVQKYHVPRVAAPAEVTVVHGIPNTPVDVYVNGKLTLPGFTFDKVAGPLALPAGTYAIAVRPQGAAPSSVPILSQSVTVSSGEEASIVANLTASGSPTLSVFADPTTPVAMGDARVIIRHLAEAPGVDVYAGTSKVVTDLTNPNQATLVVPAGSLSVSVDVTGTTTTVIGPATFDFKAGRTTVIYAIGSAAGKTLTVATETY
jgi:predicted cupin superfamily sugar epimerase